MAAKTKKAENVSEFFCPRPAGTEAFSPCEGKLIPEVGGGPVILIGHTCKFFSLEGGETMTSGEA